MNKLEESYTMYQALIDIGAKLKDARIKTGLTQAQLAKKIGSSQQVIARIEKGKNSPTLRTLMTIANATSKKIEINLSEEKIIRRKKDPENISINAYLLVFWHDVIAKLISIKEIDSTLKINSVIQHFLDRGENTLNSFLNKDPFISLSTDKEILYPSLAYSYLAGASDAMEFLWKTLQIKKMLPSATDNAKNSL
jgi:transcriptional regulator with XRE-family HTH domain